MPEPLGVRVLSAANRVAVPWLNGNGVTSEVAARPIGGDPAAFDWRLSIATIAGDNPFSNFPGIDRLLMPISPQGLDLRDGGAPVHLAQFDVYAFAGENDVASFGVTEATLDLNLMTRRDRCTGSLTLTRVAGDATLRAGDEEDVVLVVLEGSLRLGVSTLAGPDAVLLERPLTAQDAVLLQRPLTALDAVLLERGRQAAVTGTARVAVARVRPLRPLRPLRRV